MPLATYSLVDQNLGDTLKYLWTASSNVESRMIRWRWSEKGAIKLDLNRRTGCHQLISDFRPHGRNEVAAVLHLAKRPRWVAAADVFRSGKFRQQLLTTHVKNRRLAFTIGCLFSPGNIRCYSRILLHFRLTSSRNISVQIIKFVHLKVVMVWAFTIISWVTKKAILMDGKVVDLGSQPGLAAFGRGTMSFHDFVPRKNL